MPAIGFMTEVVPAIQNKHKATEYNVQTEAVEWRCNNMFDRGLVSGYTMSLLSHPPRRVPESTQLDKSSQHHRHLHTI